jgi:hypothetical protein
MIDYFPNINRMMFVRDEVCFLRGWNWILKYYMNHLQTSQV